MTYLNDEVLPRLEWQLAAAEILGVRFRWLSTGDGEIRPHDQALSDEIAPENVVFETYLETLRNSEPWLTEKVDVVTRLILARAATTLPNASPSEASHIVLDAALQPLRAVTLGIEQLPNRILNRYVAGIGHVLAAFIEDAFRNVRTKEGKVDARIMFGLVSIPVRIAAPLISVSETILVDITGFVPRDEVDYRYIAAGYHVLTAGKTGRAYNLLRIALEKSHTAAVGTLVIGSSERPCLIAAEDDRLYLDLLRDSNWVVPTRPDGGGADSSAETEGPSEREIQMATVLVEGMQTTWDPSTFISSGRATDPKERVRSQNLESNIVSTATRLAASIDAAERATSETAHHIGSLS
jgi:non-homologous end joining protein Ku